MEGRRQMTEFEKEIIKHLTDKGDFEKEVLERLARIEEQNKTLFNKIDTHEKAINGNGKKGLIDRVGKLETKFVKLEGIHTNSDKNKSSIMTWIGLLLTAAGTIYAIIKHH